MDYHDYFTVGDVIEITNKGRPPWVAGQWRVLRVKVSEAIVSPLLIDKTLDSARDDEYEYIIRFGGMERVRRGNASLRIRPSLR